jgi:hypothetical protein
MITVYYLKFLQGVHLRPKRKQKSRHFYNTTPYIKLLKSSTNSHKLIKALKNPTKQSRITQQKQHKTTNNKPKAVTIHQAVKQTETQTPGTPKTSASSSRKNTRPTPHSIIHSPGSHSHS